VTDRLVRCRPLPLLDDVASCSYIGQVRAVGVRELKNRLSEYLRMVRDGQEILVTDRGEVIAELRRPGPSARVAHPALVEALRSGRARLGSANRPDLYEPLAPVLPAGAARRLLDDDRGGR
jgi:antitoxin (DNA-binding transcriptional repressor) of toxin-antitoxin stability system